MPQYSYGSRPITSRFGGNFTGVGRTLVELDPDPKRKANSRQDLWNLAEQRRRDYRNGTKISKLHNPDASANSSVLGPDPSGGGIPSSDSDQDTASTADLSFATVEQTELPLTSGEEPSDNSSLARSDTHGEQTDLGLSLDPPYDSHQTPSASSVGSGALEITTSLSEPSVFTPSRAAGTAVDTTYTYRSEFSPVHHLKSRPSTPYFNPSTLASFFLTSLLSSYNGDHHKTPASLGGYASLSAYPPYDVPLCTTVSYNPYSTSFGGMGFPADSSPEDLSRSYRSGFIITDCDHESHKQDSASYGK